MGHSWMHRENRGQRNASDIHASSLIWVWLHRSQLAFESSPKNHNDLTPLSKSPQNKKKQSYLFIYPCNPDLKFVIVLLFAVIIIKFCCNHYHMAMIKISPISNIHGWHTWMSWLVLYKTTRLTTIIRNVMI